MEPADLIRNEQELLAATGADGPADIAESLWQYVDGVVSCFAGGVELQFGLRHVGIPYPFTLPQLTALAAALVGSELQLQAAVRGLTSSARCAVCGAGLVEFIYGYPSAEAVTAAARGEVVLGGCEPHDQAIGCPDCHDAQAVF